MISVLINRTGDPNAFFVGRKEMCMGIFDEVKRNVSVRQATERYGFKPNRSGLIRCIFHPDKTPSMKVDDRYYCFGCGCTGDAIDFTAQLFGLSAKDAALKLADDFGIDIQNSVHRNRETGKARAPGKKAVIDKNEQKDEDIKIIRLLLDYRSLLLEWKNKYAPKTRTEEWDERFMQSLRELSKVEYQLDVLLFGEEEEKKSMIEDTREEMIRIEQVCKEYSGGKTEKCYGPDGEDGGLEGGQKDPGAPSEDRKRCSEGNHA